MKPKNVIYVEYNRSVIGVVVYYKSNVLLQYITFFSN